jgi:pimeloyl-ACP methyl ester carboxylesterase
MLKLFKYFFYALLLMLLLLLSIPYLMPVVSGEIKENPYPNSRFYVSGDANMHYRIWNSNATKGNVMLIHGFSGSTYSWRYTADFLADNGFRVLAVDVPPYGFSERKSHLNYSNEAQAKRLWEICNTIDSLQPWSIAGHSMGAQIAGMMAAQVPNKCAKLIFVDGIFGNEDAVLKKPFYLAALKLSPVKRLAEAAGKIFLFNEEKFSELLESAYGEKPDSADVAAYLKPFAVKNTASCILESGVSKNTSQLNFSDVKAPTLIIWGEKDTWIPLTVGEEFSERNAIIKLYKVEGAGHCPMETHPAEFNNIILNFLK